MTLYKISSISKQDTHHGYSRKQERSLTNLQYLLPMKNGSFHSPLTFTLHDFKRSSPLAQQQTRSSDAGAHENTIINLREDNENTVLRTSSSV